jgi:hypothetical protein
LYGFVLNDMSPNKRTTERREISNNYPITVSGPELQNPLVLLNESFESTTFPPPGWLKITPTGGAGWNRQTAGTSPIPGFNGGTITVPPGGGSAVAFCNYLTGGVNANDQWLISPKLLNIQASDSLIFWFRKFGQYLDSLSVMISTTTQSIAGMTINVMTQGFDTATLNWTQYKFNIGSLVPAGSNMYIGFRQFVSNSNLWGSSFSLDLVRSTAIVSEVKNENLKPDGYNLSQNYPNPFNPTTNIDYSVGKKGFVSLKVYDLLGKEIATLVNETKNTGNYTITFNAVKLSSGVYYYKIQSGDFVDMKTMVIVK